MEGESHSEDDPDQITEQKGNSRIPTDGEVWSKVEAKSAKGSVNVTSVFSYYYCFSYQFPQLRLSCVTPHGYDVCCSTLLHVPLDCQPVQW